VERQEGRRKSFGRSSIKSEPRSIRRTCSKPTMRRQHCVCRQAQLKRSQAFRERTFNRKMAYPHSMLGLRALARPLNNVRRCKGSRVSTAVL
jgi:hypothetical protein